MNKAAPNYRISCNRKAVNCPNELPGFKLQTQYELCERVSASRSKNF